MEDQAAQRWGMPPWQVQEEAPAEWMEWLENLLIEQQDAKPTEVAIGGTMQTGNVRKTRVI